MSDFGLKVSQEGNDVKGLRNLLLNSKYPQWKCDIRVNPKLYGFIQATVNLGANETRTIFTLPHLYNYVPSFMVAWNYPAGTDKTSTITSSTYGIGAINITNTDFSLTSFTPQIDGSKFTIVASTTNAMTVLYAEFRFYIFAEDFPYRTFGDSL